jgi:endonuclease G
MTGFGKFPSLDAFLVAYEADRGMEERAKQLDLSATARMTRRRRDRDVVEVACKIAQVEPDDTHGSKHARLQVELTEVIASDPDVDGDVRRHLASHACVLVAIEYDDHHPEIPGLIAGVVIRARGEWITAERAYGVGGDKLSVLHFTHAPIGFVVVGGVTYR